MEQGSREHHAGVPAVGAIAFRHVREHAELRLLCFPYAGAGASIYRGWANRLPRWVEVCPIQLPGRETRFSEPLVSNMDDLVTSLEVALSSELSMPFAIFGHSMGATVGFELARRMQQARRRAPLALLASAAPAPQLMRYRGLDLGDEALLAWLARADGPTAEIIDAPELRAIVLERLRADASVCTRYRHREGTELECPIYAFGGSDDENVPAADLLAWRQLTAREFRHETLPGGHLYLRTSEDALLQRLSAILETLKPTPHASASGRRRRESWIFGGS